MAQQLQSATSASTMRAYLNDIGRIPLLSRSQEIEYGRQLQTMAAYQQVKLDLAAELTREPSLEEWAAKLELTIDELEAAIELGQEAKRNMVEANLRLVVKIAKLYQHNNMDLLDLIQEGTIGLQRGAEKFDPGKGYRFSTYAYWWIRQAMTRAISQSSRTIRLPIHLIEVLGQIRKSQRHLTQQLGRIPSLEEVAQNLDLTPQQVRQYMSYAKQPLSLEKRVGENADSELQDLLPDNSVLPIDWAVQQELAQSVEAVIDKLPAQMQEILISRFGLDGHDAMSLAEVGKRMNMSRERVRQLQQKAFNLIRKNSGEMRKYLAS